MNGSRRVTITAAVLLVACLAGSIVFLRRIDQLRTGATLEDVLFITSPKAVKRLSLGYDGLLADIYWTRAVQYFGGRHVAGASHFRLLAPLLEITTTLDPHLVVAYQFGANFLSPKPPNGAGMPVTESRHSLLARPADCRSPGQRSSSRTRPPSWTYCVRERSATRC